MHSGRLRFDVFEFDLATRELRREGAIVRLQSQPAQVLACLIERADQIVSREDLYKAVWGGDTFVDFDRGLNFCISQIRSALRDDSAQPRYIRTIPKYGYQFIAPLVPVLKNVAASQNTSIMSSPRIRTAVRASAIGLLALFLFAAAYRLRSAPGQSRPIVAVLRFDNETSNPEMTRFSDGLTDTVVEQLTSRSNGRYSVIGNARILRLPRDQWDLDAVAFSLHAKYVVVGQVQLHDGRTRILAHLIRLPEQTHLWVSRLDRTLEDPLGVESEMAKKIADEFSPRVSADSHGHSLPPLASH